MAFKFRSLVSWSMALKSLSSGIESCSPNSSNHMYLQSVRQCSLCLMTHGHRKIIWHLFCIEMIRFRVRDVITIPASRYENTMLSGGATEIFIRHFRIGTTTVTCGRPPISCPEWGYHTLPRCTPCTVLFQFTQLVGQQLLTSVVNTVRNWVSLCSPFLHRRATIDGNIGGNDRAFTFVPIERVRITELEFSNRCTRKMIWKWVTVFIVVPCIL